MDQMVFHMKNNYFKKLHKIFEDVCEERVQDEIHKDDFSDDIKELQNYIKTLAYYFIYFNENKDNANAHPWIAFIFAQIYQLNIVI